MAHKVGESIRNIEFRLHGLDLKTALRIYDVLHELKDFDEVMNGTVGQSWHERPEYYGEIGSGGPSYSVRVHKTKTGKEVYEIWIHEEQKGVMW